MTDEPIQAEPGPYVKPGELPLQISGIVVPGPDGSPMPALVFDYKISAHQIVMSVETAELLAEKIGAILAEAATMARRARLGLILPGQVPNLPPMPANGNGRPRG